jgi:hypothetical protein
MSSFLARKLIRGSSTDPITAHLPSQLLGEYIANTITPVVLYKSGKLNGRSAAIVVARVILAMVYRYGLKYQYSGEALRTKMGVEHTDNGRFH